VKSILPGKITTDWKTQKRKQPAEKLKDKPLSKFEYLKSVQQNGLYYLSKFCDFQRLSEEYKRLSEKEILIEIQKALGLTMTELQRVERNQELMRTRIEISHKVKVKLGARIRDPEENPLLKSKDKEFIRQISSSTSPHRMIEETEETIEHTEVVEKEKEMESEEEFQDAISPNTYFQGVPGIDAENYLEQNLVSPQRPPEETAEGEDEGSNDDSYFEEDILGDLGGRSPINNDKSPKNNGKNNKTPQKTPEVVVEEKKTEVEPQRTLHDFFKIKKLEVPQIQIEQPVNKKIIIPGGNFKYAVGEEADFKPTLRVENDVDEYYDLPNDAEIIHKV